jgi:hypothetical protein
MCGMTVTKRCLRPTGADAGADGPGSMIVLYTISVAKFRFVQWFWDWLLGLDEFSFECA